MALTSVVSRASYPGTGSVGPYPVPFRLQAAADLRVLRVSATGGESVLLLDIDYTVGGVGDTNATATLTDALLAGETLVFRRTPALTQPMSIQNQSAYFPRTIEDEADRLAMQLQALQDLADRSVGVPESIDPAGVLLRVTPETGKVLAWQSPTALGNSALDSSSVALPGGGRTMDTLTAYLMNNAVFNVRDYGALGDGATNDRAALQACLEAAKAAGGGVVYVPRGTYILLSALGSASSSDEYSDIIVLGYGATFSWTQNANNQGLALNGHRNELHGITLKGPQYAVEDTTQIGLSVRAPGTAARWTKLRLVDVTCTQWGGTGFDFAFVNDITVSRTTASYCWSHGGIARSCHYGMVTDCRFEHINADGIAGTNAYGFSISKDTSLEGGGSATEALAPVSHDWVVSHCFFNDITTWLALDSHGGNNLTFANNLFRDCRSAISAGVFVGIAGSERAPFNLVITGNRSYVVTIPRANTTYAIGIDGDGSSSQRARNVYIGGNVLDGHGQATGTPGDDNNQCTINLQYCDGVVLADNAIRNGGIAGYLIRGCLNVSGALGFVQTLAGATAAAATGTITFASNPADGDTITINGAAYTFKDAPAGAFQIQRHATVLATSLQNAVTKLNAAVDGRVSLCTYTANATILTITADTVGRSMNGVFTLAASVAAVSGATLSGGAVGAAAVVVKTLSGLYTSSGLLEGLTADVGTATGIQVCDDNAGMHFARNRHFGTGPLYDCRGSSAVPQSGCGDIGDLFEGLFTHDPASVAATGNELFYAPLPGVPGSAAVEVTVDRTLDGLVLSAQPANNFIILRLDNPSAGAVDLSSLIIQVKARQRAGASVAI